MIRGLVIRAGLVGLLAGLPSAFAQDSIPEAGSSGCLIATGLGGAPEYVETFADWGDAVERICRSGLRAEVVRLDGEVKGRAEILKVIADWAEGPKKDAWIFLIGHGAYDGREYKFNLRGPDLTGSDLAGALTSLEGKTFLVAATSSSGVLLERIAGENRVVLTATRSAQERHPPLFLSFLIEATESAEADLDKDRRISLQEAFNFTEAIVAAFYQEKGRIRSEHAVLADSPDPRPLAPSAYLAAPEEKAYRSAEARALAEQRPGLEREIEDLKLRKPTLDPEEYLRELERLLIELATLNERVRKLEAEP